MGVSPVSKIILKYWPSQILSFKKNSIVHILFKYDLQILSFKYCSSNIVLQILSFKYCPSNIALQILSFKYCPSNIVQKGTPFKILCINSNAGHSSSVVSLLSPRVKYNITHFLIINQGYYFITKCHTVQRCHDQDHVHGEH